MFFLQINSALQGLSRPMCCFGFPSLMSNSPSSTATLAPRAGLDYRGLLEVDGELLKQHNALLNHVFVILVFCSSSDNKIHI